MSSTRRDFLDGTVGAVTATALSARFLEATTARAGEGKTKTGLKVGGCTVGLEEGARCGLDGVEVRVGGPADRLEISRPEVRRQYKDRMEKTGLPISSLMMGLLNDCALATDLRTPAWLDQSINAAHDLGARVILVAFFANGDLLSSDGRVKTSDVDSVVTRLKAAAPRARDAGVILGIENYLNAEQNARILDRIVHDSVKIYYDCYNTGGTKGYDVPAEIRFLKDRIAQFHFKNGPDYLETGKPHYAPIAAAIKEIGYRGWIVLETSNPSHDAVADVKRNAEYTRELFA
jgi:L-ribulose-5-phosphate 3-epimerase